MSQFTTRHLTMLALLTLVWGFNWPVMKLGVTGYPPLTFRAASIWLGLPILGAALVALKVPFRVPRAHWRELLWLSTTNMFVWHIFVILGIAALSSGRAAILGYTMPIFSAVWGVLFFGAAMRARNWAGIAAAALAVALLLWYEFSNLSGAPVAALSVLFAAGVWAYGTQRLRATKLPVPTLAIVFWMTAMTGVVLTLAALIFERDRLALPTQPVWFAIGYNAVLIFGFAHAAWFFLARTLPPVASTLSVMMIPVLGVFSGAVLLGETLHWQDWAAVALILVAIATVLLPAGPRAASGAAS
jgi:drug/metabolite transporter (DMT)-like permease